MDILKLLKAEAEQVEVVEMQNEATTVEFESNKLKTSKVEETRGVAVRVVRHGRLGFAASSDMGAMEKLSANVLESASYGDKIPLNFPGPRPAARVQTFDSSVAELPVARLVEIGREVIEILLAVEPAAQINVSLNRGVQKLGVRTQAGANIAFDRSPLSISVEVNRVLKALQSESRPLAWEEMEKVLIRQLGEETLGRLQIDPELQKYPKVIPHKESVYIFFSNQGVSALRYANAWKVFKVLETTIRLPDLNFSFQTS